jgi:hypothetical protein
MESRFSRLPPDEMSMSQPQDLALHSEIRRLKELVERQFAELTALRMVVPSAEPPVTVDAAAYRRRPKRIVPELNTRTAREIDPALWPVRRHPTNPLWPNAGFANYSVDRSHIIVIGFAVFGLNDDALEESVKRVEDNQRQNRDFLPLFLSDSACVSVFRKRGFTYEYFPRHRFTRVNERSLRDYALVRLALVQKKWGVTGFVVLGESPLYSLGLIEQIVGSSGVQTDFKPSTVAGGH